MFYIPSSVSWLRVALSSTRPLSRSLLLWVAKHVEAIFCCKPSASEKKRGASLRAAGEEKWTVEIKKQQKVVMFFGGGFVVVSGGGGLLWKMHQDSVC